MPYGFYWVFWVLIFIESLSFSFIKKDRQEFDFMMNHFLLGYLIVRCSHLLGCKFVTYVCVLDLFNNKFGIKFYYCFNSL